MDILLGDRLHELFVTGSRLALLCGDFRNGRPDVGQRRGQVSEFHVIDRTLHGTTVGMTQDDDELRTRNFRCILEAARDVRVHEVARDPDGEDVADPLIEYKFRRHAAVHAT